MYSIEPYPSGQAFTYPGFHLPHEQNNLAQSNPEKTAEMWGVLSKYLKDVNAETVADFAGKVKKKNKAKKDQAKASPSPKGK